MIEDLMPPSIEPFLNINKDGSAMVENPIHALLGQLPRVFISIDGLDEAEYTENHPASYAIFHEKQVSTFKPASFSDSQMPLYPRILARYPGVSASNSRYKRTHQTICFSALPRFNRDPELAQDFLGSAIETEVKGRFLWASLMLVELKNTADDDDDDGKIELTMRCLPTKVSELYGKIIARIQKRGGGKEQPLWK
ncbi:hypothetical protein BDV23DRAFT_182980 [Aspergillus alliaceus]|uniref:Uncharacterized protein n=1 Tax=Petromyces alliaceus TaxID=209559 RepID=A0A5N7CAW8_PETAA|nr:hypothetical protein BDV23DRAFT_182980 [Aspergillus alliaceus]